MDDFNGEFEFFDDPNYEYNKQGESSVPFLVELLANNINMIVATEHVKGGNIEKITFFIKPPGSNGEDDDNDGGMPPYVKPLPPARPVEFELEA